MNYQEDIILQDVFQYIKSTYGEHYAGNTQVQLVDLWESEGTLSTIAVGTAQKYLSRFGKKEGLNKKDLLKAMHYIVLAMYANFYNSNVETDTTDDLEQPDVNIPVISMDSLREMILKQMQDQQQQQQQ